MTALVGYSHHARPTGLEALLIVIGRWLIDAGERRAASHAVHARYRAYERACENRSRDLAATRHSGLWP